MEGEKIVFALARAASGTSAPPAALALALEEAGAAIVEAITTAREQLGEKTG